MACRRQPGGRRQRTLATYPGYCIDLNQPHRGCIPSLHVLIVVQRLSAHRLFHQRALSVFVRRGCSPASSLLSRRNRLKTQLPAHFDRWSFRSCPHFDPVGAQRFSSRSGEKTQARFQPLDSKAFSANCKVCLAGGIRGIFRERIECGGRAHIHRKPGGTPCQGFFSG